jgi:uncharacterized membrane protein YoaK (UPF0700 family)
MTGDNANSGIQALPALLSLNAGYVDTAGFLALQGLFTAHVTGNFVTLGASLVFGTSGVVAKLIALPVFCVMVIATRLLGQALEARSRPAMLTLLVIKTCLLALGAALAILLGPFTNGDAWQAIVTGMALVASMAIQNAVHRIYLSSAPPTNLMTGTTTQIMIDLADLMRRGSSEKKAPIRARLARMAISLGAFAIGCAVAAVLFAQAGDWCFLVPPVIALLALLTTVNQGRIGV